MAIGVDNRLKAKMPSPLAPKPSAPMQTPQYAPMPSMVNQGAVDSVNNNLLAGVAGAGRMAQQQMAGRGISAGRGQQARGDMAEQLASVKAQQQAQQNNMDAAAGNQMRRFAYDTAMRGEQIQNQGLLNSLVNSRRGENLAMRGYAQNLEEARRRGQLGLDQIYLDRTPLFQSLLQGLF